MIYFFKRGMNLTGSYKYFFIVVCFSTGQAELLNRQRFTQFKGLIEDCELKRGEKEVTCQDLQGFWDIIYFQVMKNF